MANRSKILRRFIPFFSIGILFSISLTVDAQDLEISSNAALAEKIYIKSDSELYTTKQTIWLSINVTEAATNRPTRFSGVLYVELIDADENVRDEKIVKLEDGVGTSFFELGSQYLPGSYLIRAYTTWNENFDKSFIATKYIKIYPGSERNEINPIQNVSLLEESSDEFVLKADFMPLQIDSLHQKKLDVFIVLDGKKDSLSLKENRNLLYQLEYPVSKNDRLVSLSMRTSRGIYYSKTVALKESQPNLSFYPESGHMVAGVLSKIAFKGTDIKGKGVEVSGKIIDGHGHLVTSITSSQLGMGVFMLRPDSNQTYHAKIYAASDSSQTYTFDLPHAKNEGQMLTVIKQMNQIIVTGIFSSDHSQDSAFIRVSCRGRDYYHLKGRLKNGRMTAIIPINMLPEGVIAFKLLNNHKIPQAERLVFNYHPQTRLQIHTKMDSSI